MSVPFRLKQVAAFAAIYVIWGSTYLAIRFAIETLPGFTMAAVRFLFVGGLLYAFTRLRGAERPRAGQWRAAAIVGALLLAGGNGMVVWAEERLASGLAALLVATEPLWVVVVMGLWPGGGRPRPIAVAGILLGFGGVALLTLTGEPGATGAIHLPSALAVVGAALSWALGSIYAARTDRLPSSVYLSTAMQMLAGGAVLGVMGLVAGEWTTLDPAAFSARSLLALGYLVVFGTIIAFMSYSWLIRHAEPTLVSTYAYVNPVVAVFLGWLLADEPVTGRTFLAAGLILAAVVLASLGSRSRSRPTARQPAPREAPAGEAPGETEGVDGRGRIPGQAGASGGEVPLEVPLEAAV